MVVIRLNFLDLNWLKGLEMEETYKILKTAI